MKNISLLLLAIPLLLISCTRDPLADFTISNSNVGIGETVYFTNRSIDAESFEWDFGDGYFTTNFNASHFYEIDGVYNVSLKAFSHDRVDVAYMTINVIDASLEITVKEYYEPFYLVKDISVILFNSLEDWDSHDESKKIVEKFTDINGFVRFDHLASQRYYIDIYGPNHDNWQLGIEDPGFIETPILIPGTLTKFTAQVDYYPDGKKSLLSRFEVKAKRIIEAAEHAPRIKADK